MTQLGWKEITIEYNCKIINGHYKIDRKTVIAKAVRGEKQAPLSGSVESALKADGYFAIVNWHKRPREETPILGEPRGPKTELRMSPEETIKAVEGRELKFTKTVEVPPYHYGVLFKRSGV